MTKTYAETLTPDERPVAGDPEANSTLTIKQALDLGNTKVKGQYTEGKYYVTGTVKEIQHETYGNLVITDGTNDILVYGTFDASGSTKYGDMENKPGVGDTITVYGIIGFYNAPQLKDAWITSAGGSAPSTGVVDAPVAGTAYNYGMVHDGVGTEVYYISGGMAATYYFATSSDVTAALAVYLETTEGGYYMYVMEGDTKSYINYVVSGTHVNSKYEATPSTVFTYDATLKTVVTVVNGENYVLGTSASKTFTTVGPVKPDGAYYCKFYAANEASVCEHENTTTTTVDATCTEKGTTTVVCNDCDKTVSVTEIDKIAHNYVDGACSACGAAQPATGATATASKTIEELITSLGWDKTTTGQEFALDNNVTVKIAGGSNTGKAYDGNHIRIYATDTPAGTMTISVSAGYELVSIKVTTVTEGGDFAFFYLGDGTTDICNVETAVSGSSVVLNSVKNGSNGKQVRVLAIEVVYKAV
jgi:hypothetical protein